MGKAKFLELDSDPGIFTLMLQDYGLHNLLVEEIYDLDSDLSEKEILGFIFLFKWGDHFKNNIISRRKALTIEQEIESKYIFKDQNGNESPFDKLVFTRQKASNSCASHALLSILLNIEDNLVDKSSLLMSLKSDIQNVKFPDLTKSNQIKTASKRGKILARSDLIQSIHNKYASKSTTFEDEEFSDSDSFHEPEAKRVKLSIEEKSEETFHFTSFVNFNQHVVELDGMKQCAVQHERVKDSYSKTALKILKKRISEMREVSGEEEIRYSLLAVEKCPLTEFTLRLKELKTKVFNLGQDILAVSKRRKGQSEDIILDVQNVLDSFIDRKPDKRKYPKQSIQTLYKNFKTKLAEQKLLEEKILSHHKKFQEYHKDHERRVFNYDTFIESTILKLEEHKLINLHDPNNN